jgi:hypothetical protein
MRFISFLLLLAAVVAIFLFATENDGPVTVRFWDWQLTTRLALMIVAVYVLGMFSGWFVVGMVQRGIYRVTAPPRS